MPRIIVTPEQLNELSRQMTQSATQLRDLEGHLGRALGGLDWSVRQQINIDSQVNSARAQACQLAEQADSLASFLTNRAGAFQQADSQSYDNWKDTFPPAPVPAPTPAIPPGTSKGTAPSLDDAIHSLDDLLKPIDWISDSHKASQVFGKTLEEIGRLLNNLTGHRGNIKLMDQLGEFLQGTSKGVGFLSNILDVRDMNRYFAGQLTNADIAGVAIKTLFPIPILNDRFASWAIQNMVDPTGHWHGLVSPVQ